METKIELANEDRSGVEVVGIVVGEEEGAGEELLLNIKEEDRKSLGLIADEVKDLCIKWRRSSYEVAVKVGERLNRVKEIFQANNRGEYWQAWIEKELKGEISHDTSTNLINLYRLDKEHGSNYQEGLSRLSLSALYYTARGSVEPELKKEVLRMAAESEKPPSRDELATIFQVYRKVKLAEAGVIPQAIESLSESEVAENPKELKMLARYSKKKQVQLAEVLSNNDNAAKSVKEALAIIREEEKEEKKELEDQPEGLEEQSLEPTTTLKTKVYRGLATNAIKKVPGDEVDLAIVEAPMKFDFVMGTELSQLCRELSSILKPGGFALITLGHKGSMFCGAAIEIGGLTPLHLIVLRRQSGRSRSIVGINITSASVIMALVYKPPYRAPKKMLVDLQTIVEEESPPEVIEELTEIGNGIEECLRRLLTPLLTAGSTVLHCIYSQEHFSIRSHIKSVASDSGVSKFIEIG